MGFDFVFNTRHADHTNGSRGGDHDPSGTINKACLNRRSFRFASEAMTVCYGDSSDGKDLGCGSNPLIGIQLLPRPHVACQRSARFATIPFA